MQERACAAVSAAAAKWMQLGGQQACVVSMQITPGSGLLVSYEAAAVAESASGLTELCWRRWLRWRREWEGRVQECACGAPAAARPPSAPG